MTEAEEQAQQLLEEGFALLGRGDFPHAIEVGERLRDMHHSAGFEIIGQSLAASGRTEQAIQVLQEGVQFAPDVWLLWQSLANMYADRMRFPEAHEAYGRALACSQADSSSIHYNRALAYARDKDFEEAVRCLDLVDGPHLQFKAQSVRLAALNDLQRFEEAMAAARELTETYAAPQPPPPDYREDMARVHAQMGRSAWLQSRDADTARAQAVQALSLHRGEPTALWLLREMDGDKSVERKFFRVQLADGRLYELVATDEAHALQLVASLEGQPLESLQAEATALDFEPQGPTGVYRVT